MEKDIKKKVKIEEGKCHGCGESVEKNVCICTKCIRKGVTHESLGLLDEWRKEYGEARGWDDDWWKD